jgi:hypothetical protein
MGPDHSQPQPAVAPPEAATEPSSLQTTPAFEALDGILEALRATGLNRNGALWHLVKADMWREVAALGIATLQEPTRVRRGLRNIALAARGMAAEDVPELLEMLRGADLHPFCVALAAPWDCKKVTVQDIEVQDVNVAIRLAQRLGVHPDFTNLIRKGDNGRLFVTIGKTLNMPSSMRILPVGLIVDGASIGLPERLAVCGQLVLKGGAKLLRPFPTTLRVNSYLKIVGQTEPIRLPEDLFVGKHLQVEPSRFCAGSEPLPSRMTVGGDLMFRDPHWDGHLPEGVAVDGKVITLDHPVGVQPDRYRSGHARALRKKAALAQSSTGDPVPA